MAIVKSAERKHGGYSAKTKAAVEYLKKIAKIVRGVNL